MKGKEKVFEGDFSVMSIFIIMSFNRKVKIFEPGHYLHVHKPVFRIV